MGENAPLFRLSSFFPLLSVRVEPVETLFILARPGWRSERFDRLKANGDKE